MHHPARMTKADNCVVGSCAFLFFMGPATFLYYRFIGLPMQGFVSSPAWTALCTISSRETLRECTMLMPGAPSWCTEHQVEVHSGSGLAYDPSRGHAHESSQ